MSSQNLTVEKRILKVWVVIVSFCFTLSWKISERKWWHFSVKCGFTDEGGCNLFITMLPSQQNYSWCLQQKEKMHPDNKLQSTYWSIWYRLELNGTDREEWQRGGCKKLWTLSSAEGALSSVCYYECIHPYSMWGHRKLTVGNVFRENNACVACMQTFYWKTWTLRDRPTFFFNMSHFCISKMST